MISVNNQPMNPVIWRRQLRGCEPGGL